jgi:hypothetical protein
VRECGTVSGNKREGERHLSNCEAFGINDPYPPRVPFPVKDGCGMQMACSLLLQSLDPGKNADKIQYETMQKLRSHMSNFVHTTPRGLGGKFMADDEKGGTELASPTNADWFKWFMRDIWIPDCALTIQELLCCQTLLESDQELFEGDADGQLKTALMAVSMIGGFAAGLRGDEIVRMDLGAIRKHWKESMDHPDLPSCLRVVSNRKLENNYSALESKSGLQICLWMFRLIRAYKALQVEWMGRYSGQQARHKGQFGERKYLIWIG